MAHGLQTFHELKPEIMKALSEIFRSLFGGNKRTPTVNTVEEALNPVHEKDIYNGSEFLDDQIRTDDTEEDEMNK